MKNLACLLCLLLLLVGCKESPSKSTQDEKPPVTTTASVEKPVAKAKSAKRAFLLPFGRSSTSEEVKKEITEVVSAFRKLDEDIDLNLKKIEDDGYISRIWWRDGQIYGSEVVDFELGANGSVMAYYDAMGNVRLMVASSNGSSWFRENYFYKTLDGKVFSFFKGGDITYDNDGIGHHDGEDKPLWQVLKPIEEAEGGDFETAQSKGENLFEIAQEISDERSGIFNFQGQIQWKYDFILNMDVELDGTVQGKYRYRKSSSDLTLSGGVRGERFHLQEKDAQGNLTGTWKGRWTELDKIEGKWWAPGKKDYKFVEMSPINAYQFKD